MVRKTDATKKLGENGRNETTASAGEQEDKNRSLSGKGPSTEAPAKSTKKAAIAALGGANKTRLSADGVSSSGATPDRAVSEDPSSSSSSSLQRHSRQQQQQQQQQPAATRPCLIPDPLWLRLSQEFNHSQLRAVWAAAASAGEIRQELQRERRSAAAAGAAAAAGGATDDAARNAGGHRPSDGNHAGRGGSADRARDFRQTAEGGVVLLQGPPGTGKTRTVLGVVSAILARQKEDMAGDGGGKSVAGAAGSGVSGRGMGTTLDVGARRKRPGGVGRWAAAKTHQRVRRKE